MVENRETRENVEGVLRLGRATEEREDAGLETEEMREGQVRGDLWVSRLNAEQEADMMMIDTQDDAIKGGGCSNAAGLKRKRKGRRGRKGGKYGENSRLTLLGGNPREEGEKERDGELRSP